MSFAAESESVKTSGLLSGKGKSGIAIEKPIVVYGAGRSGSTIFHSLLSKHPDVAWMSGLCQRYPTKPYYNRALLRMLDVPGLSGLVSKRFKPFENYPFWEHYCKGFAEPCRDLTPDDLTNRSKTGLLDALSHIAPASRSRLLLKITGWPRLGLLYALYPDVKFVHVFRDGRAVANSIMNVTFWRGWMGPDKWRWGPLPPAYEKEWIDSGKSFTVLAGLQWKILMDAAEAAKEYVAPENIMEVKYEDFCDNPGDISKSVAEFCELDWPASFESFMRGQKLKAANYKWKEALTQKQQTDLEKCLDGHLRKYGYK